MTWKTSDSQNWHNSVIREIGGKINPKACNEQNCIGFKLEPNKKKYVSNFPERHEYIKESQYMTKAQYKKALAEIRKIARKINPKIIVRKGDKGTGMYLTLVKNDPYKNHSIRVFHYGYNVVTEIQLQFADKKGRKHIKRIMVTHLHRFEFGITKLIRHYNRIYKK